jgi:S-adenosylmethionine decarboxylase
VQTVFPARRARRRPTFFTESKKKSCTAKKRHYIPSLATSFQAQGLNFPAAHVAWLEAYSGQAVRNFNLAAEAFWCARGPRRKVGWLNVFFSGGDAAMALATMKRTAIDATQSTYADRARTKTVPVLLPVAQPVHAQADNDKDYWITRNGLTYAGSHIILDLWDATGLDDIETMERAMTEAVTAAGATLLHIHLHKFTPNGGISGVAVLAESHISVHTWPEKGFAAFDVFMCGDAQPLKAIPVLETAFRPKRVVVGEHKRGVI